MGVGSGRQGGPPLIFIQGTDITDRGLIELFFVFFCYFSVFFAIFSVFFSVAPPGRGLIVLFCVFFAILLFFGLFSVAPSPP